MNKLDGKPSAKGSLTLRPARENDAMLLFGWANKADSLANKLETDDPISWPDHETWFKARLSDEIGGLWIGARAVEPVGQVRLQLIGDVFEIDIYVVQAARREGVARQMLELVAKNGRSRWPGVPFIARILPDNSASKRLFAAAGYEIDGVAENHVRMRLVTKA